MQQTHYRAGMSGVRGMSHHSTEILIKGAERTSLETHGGGKDAGPIGCTCVVTRHRPGH